MTEDELDQTLSQISLHRPRRARRAARRRRRSGDGGGSSTVGDTIADRAQRPGRGVRGRRDEAPARRHDQPHARPRAARAHALLLRGPHARGDRQVLGVTESRVCQIHTKAILQLRARLDRTRVTGRPASRTGLAPHARVVTHAPVRGPPAPFALIAPRSLLPRAFPGPVRVPREGRCVRPPCPARHRVLVAIAIAAAVVVGAPPAAAEPARSRHPVGSVGPPVGGPVVRPFTEPTRAYAAGHRGVDFAAAPGTPVRAANDGIVSFAGNVAGSLHVVVAHGGGIRTSYSFLATVDVRTGQHVRARPGRRSCRRRRRRPRSRRPPLRRSRRGPLRRPDAPLPPARPHADGPPDPRRRARARGRTGSTGGPARTSRLSSTSTIATAPASSATSRTSSGSAASPTQPVTPWTPSWTTPGGG